MQITKEFLESVRKLQEVKSTSTLKVDWEMIFVEAKIDLEEQNNIRSALTNAQKDYYLSSETIKKIANFLSVDSNLFFWMDKDTSIDNPANKQRIIIAERIIRKRQSLNYSTQDLADIAGVSRATLTNLETGKKDLTMNNLLRIMFALNMRPMDLLAFEEDLLRFNHFKEELLNNPKDFVDDLRILSRDLDSFLENSEILDSVEKRTVENFKTEGNISSRKYMQQSADKFQENVVAYEAKEKNPVLTYLGVATVLSGALFASIAVPATTPVFGGLLLMEHIKRRQDKASTK